jgi:hypothetical protein
MASTRSGACDATMSQGMWAFDCGHVAPRTGYATINRPKKRKKKKKKIREWLCPHRRPSLSACADADRSTDILQYKHTHTLNARHPNCNSTAGALWHDSSRPTMPDLAACGVTHRLSAWYESEPCSSLNQLNPPAAPSSAKPGPAQPSSVSSSAVVRPSPGSFAALDIVSWKHRVKPLISRARTRKANSRFHSPD